MNKTNKSPEQYMKRMRWVKIKFLIVSLFGPKYKHRWLKRNDVFGLFGKNVLFQPHTLPRNPKLLKIHDNVKIAANVTFYEHDVINSMFALIDKSKRGRWPLHQTGIEIFENSFIGGCSVIIGDIKIGPNAIVAGGSVVVKDVEPGTVVAGNPAKVIGTFNNLFAKRLQSDYSETDKRYTRPNNEIWNKHYELKKAKSGG